MMNQQMGKIGKLLNSIAKIHKAGEEFNKRILNLKGREFFGKYLGQDTPNTAELILTNFPSLYVRDTRRKAIILSQTSELQVVRSKTTTWKLCYVRIWDILMETSQSFDMGRKLK